MKNKNMKRLFWAFFLLPSLFSLHSCDKKTEYHYTAIYYPTVKGFVYADQTLDSINFVTFDSWQLTCDAAWLHIPENMQGGNVPEGYFIQPSVPLTFEPNTTGESRTALVNLHANGNVLSTLYEQLPYLNVIYPARRNSLCELTDSAFVTTDSLIFQAHGMWKVEFKDTDAEWITWEEGTLKQGAPGRNKLVFNMQENRMPEERKAVIRLTSNGVADSVMIVQLPPKTENQTQE